MRSSMTKPDSFTTKRLVRFTGEFRARHARLPTLRDMEENGFAKELVDHAVKERRLVELYVTLTTGAVVKGYKVSGP